MALKEYIKFLDEVEQDPIEYEEYLGTAEQQAKFEIINTILRGQLIDLQSSKVHIDEIGLRPQAVIEEGLLNNAITFITSKLSENQIAVIRNSIGVRHRNAKILISRIIKEYIQQWLLNDQLIPDACRICGYAYTSEFDRRMHNQAVHLHRLVVRGVNRILYKTSQWKIKTNVKLIT